MQSYSIQIFCTSRVYANIMFFKALRMWFLNITRGFIFPSLKSVDMSNFGNYVKGYFQLGMVWVPIVAFWRMAHCGLESFSPFCTFVIVACHQMPHGGMLGLFSDTQGVMAVLSSQQGCWPLHQAASPLVSSAQCLRSISVLLRYGNGTFCDPHRLDWPSSSCKTPEQSACHVVHGCWHVPPAFPPTDMISVRIRPCLCHYGPGARLTTWHVILIKRLLNEWKNGLIWSS